MGGGGKAPKPTAEERALQAAQTQLLTRQGQMLEEQYRQQELLAPILYKQAGLTPKYEMLSPKSTLEQFADKNPNMRGVVEEFKKTGGAYMPQFQEYLAKQGRTDVLEAAKSFTPDTTETQGRIIGYDEAAPTEADKLREDIELRMLQRSSAALKGELPDDPNLLRGLERQEKTLRETMEARFGPGWETSSPGIEALGDFQANKEGILYNARRDQLTTSEALGLSREASNQGRFYQGVGTATGNAQSIASLFGQAAQGYSPVIQGMRGERMQAGANRAQTQSAMWGAGGAVVGTAAGVAIAM